MSELETGLARLVEQQVLSASQAEELLDAARPDRLDGQSSAAEPAPRTTPKGAAVLEVLGYVGGALVLGAVIMLGSFFWDDLGSTGRKLVAVASLVVPAVGGAVLVKGGVRPELGRILLALACYAAGFAYLVVFEDQKFVVSTIVVVLLAGGTGSRGRWAAAQPTPRMVTGRFQRLGSEHRRAGRRLVRRVALASGRNNRLRGAAHSFRADASVRLRRDRLCDLAHDLAGLALPDT
jgi:hypothetical protein